MNKRIRELANEARIEVGQRIGYNDRDRDNAFEEVFAELIVKECCEVAHCNFHVDGLTLGGILKEHFGVEE